MSLLKYHPVKFDSVISDYKKSYPKMPIRERFKNGRFQAVQKFPDGDKYDCRVFESRSAMARLRLRDKYYQKRFQKYETMINMFPSHDVERLDAINGDVWVFTERDPALPRVIHLH